MGKKDLKADMMALLQEDEDLQSVIRNICVRKPVEKAKTSLLDKLLPGSSLTPENSGRAMPEKLQNNSEAEITELRAKLAAKEKAIAEQSGRIKALEKEEIERKRLEKLLDMAQRDNEKMQQELSDEKRAYQKLEGQMKQLDTSLEKLRKSAENLKKQTDEMNRKNEEQARMLSQRFPVGWDLFHAYQGVSEQSRRLLGGVFVKADDFTSFICGGAQDRSLEKIWDVIKGCLVQGNTSDADVLWDIFEYDLELVNAAKTERIYDIMEAKPGDPFDIDIHALAAGSRAQGNIREVYLLGYKNVYANRVERKSIVKV